jgi:hypothetical protein
MQTSAFPELDRLYTQILSTYDDPKVLVDILGVVLALEDDDISILTDLEVMAEIAGLGEGTVHLVLRALQSLTKIRIEPIYDDEDGEPNGMIHQRVQLSHRSFHDFLTNKERSGPYFIDTNFSIGQIFCRIFELTTVTVEKFKR